MYRARVNGFRLRGPITGIEVIAVGRGIRDVRMLRRVYGRGRWRKLKGRALVELPDERVVEAELHRYEAHGLGRVDMKVKRLLE